ncbi:hypothetical protein [Frankia sp. QA3]|uniref:hypothetical protein n=1 Tax=Frankia sp. QA3 TaxID=710111 RepID=UPI000269BB87|nr:hypothetical protein [Frankia sp. QA3]EIV91266.1 hypothetical protein FraQA3DRAFT_0701 [Frankia sp. QA3]
MSIAAEAPEAARLSTLLLHQLADLVASLDEHQVGELLAGRARLTVTAAPGRRAADPAADPADASPAVLRDTDPRPAAPAPSRAAPATAAPATAPTTATPARATSPAVSSSPAKRAAPSAKGTPPVARRQATRTGSGTKTQAALPASVDVEALRAALLGAASREEAADRLATLGRVSVPQLRALAGALGVDGVGGKDPKATVIRKIVDGTVGFRLSSQAMLSEEADL